MKRINLLPPEIGKRRRARQVTSAFVFAGVVYVALLGVLWLLGNGRLNSAKQELADAADRADAAQAQVAQLREYANLQAVVDRKERTLATAMAGDVHWSRVLVELSMVIPGDAWLTSLSGTASGAATPPGGAAPSRAPAPAPGAPAPAPGTPAPAPGTTTGPPNLGTLTFGAVTFDFPGVSTWITRLSNDRSLQTIWVPSATKGQIGTRNVVKFNSTGDLSTGAASKRYEQPEATP
jgi:Tfp pilus assembly protein PilN